VYVPAEAYVWFVVWPEPELLSPKFQEYAAIVPSLSVEPDPLKLQARFVHEFVNEAVGGLFVEPVTPMRL
jgi:hypothetical protein